MTDTDRRSLKHRVALGAALVAVVLALGWLVSRHGTAAAWFLAGALTASTRRLLAVNAFWALACLPGLLALYYYFFIARRSFVSRRKSVREYRAFRQDYDVSRGRHGIFGDAEAEDDWIRHLSEYVAGATVLTLPFLLVAWLGHGTPAALTRDPPAPAPQAEVAPPWAPVAAPQAEVTPPWAPAIVTADGGAPRPAGAQLEGRGAGIEGLVLAGYGAFFYLLVLLIYRVNAAALSPKFLVTSTLRVSIALVLGFLAGYSGLFGALVTDGTPRSILFVLVGAFPSYAGTWLQRKARELFKRSIPGTEPLPLELIDGIDELLAERLAEMGISDIQHLATIDPGELTLRTLYPFARVIDWIDQAILVTYLKADIVKARELCIRGAIDMRGTYREFLASAAHPAAPGAGAPAGPPPAGTAAALLEDLAAKCNRPVHVIHTVGESLVNDYQVEFLADLWHRRGLPHGVGAAVRGAIAEALEDERPTRERYRDHIIAGATNGLAREKDFEGELKHALDRRLEALRLAWRGHLADLEGATDAEIEEVILRHVGPERRRSSPAA